MVQLLLERGAEVNVQNKYGETPLYMAAWSGHSDVVKMLLDGGAKPDLVTKLGCTPMHMAASNGHIKVVQLLLESGAKPNVANAFRNTPLCIWHTMPLCHYANAYGYKDIANILREYGGE